jgi:DNA-binding transcriptional regulator YiaG
MENTTNSKQTEAWQERLATDKQGSALRELRDYLSVKQGELRRLLDAGTDPETFELHQKLLAAVVAADSAALAFWEKHNKE